MSRLIDRILKGCETFRASLVDPVEWAQITKANLQEYSEGSVQDKKITNQLPAITGQIKQTEAVAIEEFDFNKLEGVPVFAADDVGLYTSSLPKGTNMSDVVASMAATFDRFFIRLRQNTPQLAAGRFIEFQRIPNEFGLNGWGAFISAIDEPSEMLDADGVIEKARWELHFDTFLEREKGSLLK